ncbi:TonB-dependent receptor [Tolypothrix sp. VBCCA 56010]|uniref:TonB-dependent receptor n=1 Tax=Tolypothrix sp. VBCCA 56010 TaxID=3137731 RepID=UPI003D7E5D5F
MTIIISAQAHEELFEEVNETPQNNDPDDRLDVTWKCPQTLGEGHLRRVELRQNLVLEIESYQRHDNLIKQRIDHPHPLEFWLMLSGQWWENSPWGVNQTAAGQYGFCGSGMIVKGEDEFSQGQQLLVGVHLEPELFQSFIGNSSGELPKALQHSDNWQLRNSVALSLNRLTRNEALPQTIVDDRFLTNYQTYEGKTRDNNYFGQIDLLGKFNTGSISHQLLVGFDLNYFSGDYLYVSPSINVPDLDILNPNYDIPRPEFDISDGGGTTRTQSYGVYLQDQIALSDNLKLLIGGRYDWLSNENEIGNLEFQREGSKTVQNDGAFSPRIGFVYQPSKTVSLYASYSQSFKQSLGFNPDGRAFLPSRGTQYEVGVKADFLDGKLSTTLAAYQLTKTNITTPDPNDRRFSIQTGEQQSRGIELDIGGEILPGLKVIGSYSYLSHSQIYSNINYLFSWS